MKSAVRVWREKEERYKNLDKTARVVSWTKIMEPMDGFGRMSYVVVLIKMKDGQKAVGQIVGKLPKTGDKVVGVLRRWSDKSEKKGAIEYGVKWRKV